MIKTINLTKRYGKTLAVDSLNLHIQKGTIFGFIGPNGAGSSNRIPALSLSGEQTSKKHRRMPNGP